MSSVNHYGAVQPISSDERNRNASESHHRRNTDATSRSRLSSELESLIRSRRSTELPRFSEQDPTLPPRSRSTSPSAASSSTIQQAHHRASTLWLLPIILLAGISRGITMAPRIEVYTKIACDEIHPQIPSLLPQNFTASPSFVHRDFQLAPSPLLLDSSLSFTTLHIPRFLETNITQQDEITVTTPPPECLHDPAVQSRAAGIQATLGTVMGILSIITAGYWGQISDAFGRKVVFSTVLFGMTFHDVIYILVSIPNSVFQRHAWIVLIIGPVVEGLLGSLPTLHAAENAFLADLAQAGSRSTVFAYFQGFSYIALALGPSIASFALRVSSLEPRTTLFYTGLAFNIAVLSYALLVIPESVTPEMMQDARHPHQDETNVDSDIEAKKGWARRIRAAKDRLLAPLIIFAPKRKPGGGWELNMTLLVIAQFTHLMSVGVVQVKFLYAQHTFEWSVKQLGYYISLLWVLRAFHLLLLLPTIVRFIKPKPVTSTTMSGRSLAISQDLKFDYRIAQASIFIDTMAYVLTLIAPASSAVLFVCFTCLSSFTAGVNPAIHSIAVSYLLAHNDNANIGQMFGGMSMLQAISHTLQPLVFGVLYSKTVATYPKAIFALAAGLLISSSALFTLLRTNVSPRVDTEEVIEEEEGEETRLLSDEPVDIGERRSREEHSKVLQVDEQGSGSQR